LAHLRFADDDGDGAIRRDFHESVGDKFGASRGERDFAGRQGGKMQGDDQAAGGGRTRLEEVTAVHFAANRWVGAAHCVSSPFVVGVFPSATSAAARWMARRMRG